MFKVGDEVVCVRDTDGYNPVNGRIKKGNIYTVNEVDFDNDITLTGTTPTHTKWFCGSRFRKVEKKPFTNALTKELANTPIIEEKVEKARELETV